MPFHNFTLADLAGCLEAIALFPLFVLIPGYAAAWALHLFDFRERSFAFRLALSVPLSIALCPIVTYLAGRFGSMFAVYAVYAAAALYFVSILPGSLRNCTLRIPRLATVTATVWLAIALYSLIDIQIGDRLYFPTSTIDHALRSAVIHSISSTGIPPQNPFFWPGHGVALRYHYFWFMMCSLVDVAGGAAVSPRQSLMGGTFWCGLGLIGLLAVYLRLYSPADCRVRPRLRIGILLLGITGLDLLPSLWFLLLHFKAGLETVLPSVEWWNEHVDWFLYSAIWAPHALAAMIACFMAFLLLSRAAFARNTATLLRYSVPAGFALASSAGMSIYVTFVFGVFLAVWTPVTFVRKWRRETAALAIAGALCIALAFPYLNDLRGPGAGGPLFSFSIRTFSLAALVPNWGGMGPSLRMLLINLPLVPVNYILELGFFFFIGWIRWRQFRRDGRKLTRPELACAILAGTAVLICTFLRSSVIGCNDLGWRGFLPAEFVLLLWSVDILSAWHRPRFLSENQKSILALCLFVGAAGTLYDLAIVRLHPILADAGRIPPLDWMAPDRQIGKRTYAQRAAYEWAHRVTPESATFQFNPKVVFQDAFSMYYSERRNIAGDMTCLSIFGGDPRQCPAVISRLQQIYPEDPRQAPATLNDACSTAGADLLVAKDTDRVWTNRASWVWTETPAFANAYVRLFPCRGADDRIASSARVEHPIRQTTNDDDLPHQIKPR